MSLARRLYRALHRGARSVVRTLGFEVARTDDYYSPLPSLPELGRHRRRWDRPSELVGIDYDLDQMRARLSVLVSGHDAEYQALQPWSEAKELGYGPGFTELDARILFLTLRDLKPRRFFEIGSGISSWYATKALELNRVDGHPSQVVAIDPFARRAVEALPGLEVVREPVQGLDVDYFRELEAGDVLFIDSTHVVKLDGDVPHLYLEVLPRLAPGVSIHSHDIHFPYNVPYPAEEYVFGAKWPRFWTESMLLQAFLSFNREFRIELSLPLLRFFDEGFLGETLPGYRGVEPKRYDTHFGSLWYRRQP